MGANLSGSSRTRFRAVASIAKVLFTIPSYWLNALYSHGYRAGIYSSPNRPENPNTNLVISNNLERNLLRSSPFRECCG